MYILVVGLNFRTAPIEIRERLTFRKEALSGAISQLKQTSRILECVLLATCNRTELYAVADRLPAAREHLCSFLMNYFQVPKDMLTEHLYIYEQEMAVRHLFRVTSGLDSQVLGETQILGQVRDAFLLAQQSGATGSWFNRLFKQAITLAKRIHTETELGEHPVSVSYAAVELARKKLGGLEDKSVMILGAGKMGMLTVKHLCSQGIQDLFICNRTSARAEDLASQSNGMVVDWNQRIGALQYVDVIVSSTGAGDFVITHEQLTWAMKHRQGRPVMLIDLAMPRDLDPEIASIEHVFLYDLDDLNQVIDGNLAMRQAVAGRVQEWIHSEADDFNGWIAMQGVVPLMQALHEKTARIQEEMMQSLLLKLPELTARQTKVIRKLTKSVINQTLKDPILRLKEMAGEPEQDQIIRQFEKLFALETRADELREEKHFSETGAATPAE